MSCGFSQSLLLSCAEERTRTHRPLVAHAHHVFVAQGNMMPVTQYFLSSFGGFFLASSLSFYSLSLFLIFFSLFISHYLLSLAIAHRLCLISLFSSIHKQIHSLLFSSISLTHVLTRKCTAHTFSFLRLSFFPFTFIFPHSVCFFAFFE